MKRAVITGLGVISSIGNNKQEVLESLQIGRSGLTIPRNCKKQACVAMSGEISNWIQMD